MRHDLHVVFSVLEDILQLLRKPPPAPLPVSKLQEECVWVLSAETDHSGDGVGGHPVLEFVAELPRQVVADEGPVMVQYKVSVIAQADVRSRLVNCVQVINEGPLHAIIAKPELACGHIIEPLVLLPVGHSVVAFSERWLGVIEDLFYVVFGHVLPEYHCGILRLGLVQTCRNCPCRKKDVDSVPILDIAAEPPVLAHTDFYFLVFTLFGQSVNFRFIKHSKHASELLGLLSIK